MLLIMTTLPAPAGSTERPEDFVRRVYARYGNDGPAVPMDRPGGAAFYTARLLDAFKRDTTSPHGAGVTSEWDPICDCHAFSNLRIKRVTIAGTRTEKVRAKVVFTNLRFAHTVTLTLSRTADGWRIADIGIQDASYKDVGDRNVTSVMTLLRTSNAHHAQTRAIKGDGT